MKKLIFGTLAAAICLYVLPPEVLAAELVPVGEVIGLELSNGAVSVAEFDEILGGPAKAAGLQIGDEILDIDGMTIDSAEDVRLALERSDGQVVLRILRNEQEQTLNLRPQVTAQGPRLGVGLRQGITGIGTVTWYDPATGRFGSLGHGVNGPDGKLVEMSGGRAYDASVLSVKRGKCGEPGQLRGGVDGDRPIGSLDKNTSRGVFGSCDRGWQGETMETAATVRPGPATILSTVSGDRVQEYSVEILKIYPQNKTEGRNLLLRVTDQKLLQTTGGIVQGMSGSPILQNNKLVGAVTHVLVNDPTTGYGIFIENMLDAAA
ncbi:MAG: PDZ domain-containing protein [Oscillospiraceae bacterium]|nr:PDZ domain-containing protein [Oscillospiraceae bacterium]